VSCDLCTSILWGIVRTGYRCQDCGLNCHEKCRELVPKACTRRDVAEQGEVGGGAGGGGGQQDSLGYPQGRQESRDSNVLHKGYLYKRGALLKAWKQRWFQLDTIKHQLLYYDSREDQFVRAAIDLSTVTNVTQPANIPPGAPKKADERCFFDVHTSRRSYSLCAETRQEAQDWQDKIQSCL